MVILHVRQKLSECQAQIKFQAQVEVHLDVFKVLRVHTAFNGDLVPHMRRRASSGAALSGLAQCPRFSFSIIFNGSLRKKKTAEPSS